jgi:GAF domain-containing protein
MESIAGRLAEHLDSLRLEAQIQTSLAATETLYEGSANVVRAATSSDVLSAVVNATALHNFEHAHVLWFSTAWQEQMPAEGTIVGVWERSGQASPTPLGTHSNLQQLGIGALLRHSEPVYFADTQKVVIQSEESRQLLARIGRSLAIFPLTVADQWLGWMLLNSDAPVSLDDAQLRQIQSLIGQAAAVIQGLQLLEQTQACPA